MHQRLQNNKEILAKRGNRLLKINLCPEGFGHPGKFGASIETALPNERGRKQNPGSPWVRCHYKLGSGTTFDILQQFEFLGDKRDSQI